MEEIIKTDAADDQKKFEYKVSVIVPVYNVEQYLRDCLDSLLAQTIDHEQMEVLLINDGSTDNSLAICEEYAELFSVFKVFSKENEGVSSARNLGIRNAKGKYLMYLDSDDMLTPETVKEVTDFFDTVYDKVDLVTYKIQPIKNGVQASLHFRYNYLTKKGVYDLNKFPYITQTTMNVIVKNFIIENPLFDTTLFIHEDQEYINKILKRKGKIGYCNKGEYQWKRNDYSTMATKAFPLYCFESAIDYYEKSFELYEKDLCSYYQAMFIHNMNYKLRDNVLFPYHKGKNEFKAAMERISKLISRVDISLILNHPNIDKFHKYFFLSLRNQPIFPIIYKDNCKLICENEVVLTEKSIEVIIRRIKILNGKTLRIYGSLKSPIFSFIEQPTMHAVVNDTHNMRCELNLSGSSWYKSKTKTNTFWAFIFEYDINSLNSLSFKVEMDGILFNTRFWFAGQSPFSGSIKLQKYILDDHIVEFKQNKFFFTYANDELKCQILNANRQFYSNEINEARKIYISYKEQHKNKIWLYYDNYTVEFDNGYLQFINDFEHVDGINRYYVYDCEFNKIEHLFNKKHYKKLVRFGSLKHKILYLASSKIFTSFIEHFSLSPFVSSEEKNYIDIFNAEIIYLQHGVLHANIPWYYTPEMVEADKVVVSSYFETQNMVERYGYKKDDLIPTGMPRYDRIDKKKLPQNKILFAPSWRDYLIGKFVDSGARRELYDTKLLNSIYYKSTFKFINSDKLNYVLEKYDLYLDLKLHPNFYDTYSHLFSIESDRVALAPNKVDLTNYKVFITDFSSFVFDYAYLSRPIIYFVPDYLEFISGMNRYRELDLPFEKAFGNMFTDPEAVVDEIQRIIQNDFQPDTVFKERMDNFFLPLDNCSEKLYEYLISDEKDNEK